MPDPLAEFNATTPAPATDERRELVHVVVDSERKARPIDVRRDVLDPTDVTFLGELVVDMILLRADRLEAKLHRPLTVDEYAKVFQSEKVQRLEHVRAKLHRLVHLVRWPDE